MTPDEVDLLGVLDDDCRRCGRDLSTDCLCDESEPCHHTHVTGDPGDGLCHDCGVGGL